MTSDFVNRLLVQCDLEHHRFDEGRRTETQNPQYQFVGEYWQSVGLSFDGRSKVDGERPPWSAAFISFVMRQAGAIETFEHRSAHCHYIFQSMLQADGTRAGFAYTARRPEQYAPKLGDIVVAGRLAASRLTYDDAPRVYLANTFFPSHGDIVTKINESRIETIGGNVRQSVSRKFYRLDQHGLLMPRRIRGQNYPWIAVLECVI